MAAVAGPRFWQNGGQPMSKTPRPPSITPGTGKVPAPVRVKLKRVSCNHAIPYPPDGQAREWWQRLKNAFGTASSAFVEASLYQLIAAARLPNSGICEIAVNASLALVEGAKPQGEVEGALVLQMACTHAASMAVLATFAGVHGIRRSQVSAARPESLGGGIHQRVRGLWHSAAAPAARPHPSTGQAPARSQADRRSPTCAYSFRRPGGGRHHQFGEGQRWARWQPGAGQFIAIEELT